MAIGPTDIELNDAEKNEVARYEEKIDAELRRLYSSEAKIIRVRVGQVLDERIITELIARYKKAGWSDVKYDHLEELRFTA